CRRSRCWAASGFRLRSASSSATTQPGRRRTSIRSKRFATSSGPMRTLPPRARVLLLVALLAGGCAVGPDFVRQAAPSMTGYETQPIALPAPGDPDPAQRFVADGIARQWWQLFQSPALDEVLTLAVADSPTLVSARATLAQAEEVIVVARAAYYP